MLAWLHNLLAWLAGHERFVAYALALSMLTFVGSIVLVTALIVRMPSDYFSKREAPSHGWPGLHPAVRLAFIIGKNLVGVVIMVVGVILLLPGVPGQGVLTILIGLTLVDFPGKRTLELRVVRFQPVLRAINWIRTKNHRPPLQLPDRVAR